MGVDPDAVVAGWQGITEQQREQMRQARAMHGLATMIPEAYRTGAVLRDTRQDAEGQGYADQADQTGAQALQYLQHMNGVQGPYGAPIPAPEPEGKSFVTRLGEVLGSGDRLLAGAVHGYRTALPGESTLGRMGSEALHSVFNPDDDVTLMSEGRTIGEQQLGMPRLGAALGFATSLVADPLNYVGGPIAKLGMRGLGVAGSALGHTGSAGALLGAYEGATHGGLIGAGIGAAVGGGVGKALGHYAPGVERGLVQAERFVQRAFVPGAETGHLGREAVEAGPNPGGLMEYEQAAKQDVARRSNNATKLAIQSGQTGKPVAQLIAENEAKVIKRPPMLNEVTGLKEKIDAASRRFPSVIGRETEDLVQEGLKNPLTADELRLDAKEIRDRAAKQFILGDKAAGTSLPGKADFEGLKNLTDANGLPIATTAFTKPGKIKGSMEYITIPGSSVPQSKVWRQFAKDPAGRVLAVPHELARHIDELQGMGAPGWLDALEGSHPWAQSIVKGLRAFDNAFSYYWKGTVVGLNPATGARNFLTNQTLAYQQFGAKRWAEGVFKYDLPTYKILGGGTGELVAGGAKLTYQQIREIMLTPGIHHSGQAANDVVSSVEKLAELQQMTWRKAAVSAVPGLGGDPSKLWSKAIERARGLQSGIEDHSKVVTLLTAMDHTNGDIDKAVELTRRTLFDYADFTSFERNVAAKVVPFYRFMRKNAEYQVDRLLNAPARTGAIFKFVKDAEKIALNPEQQDRYNREIPGESLKGRFAVPTGAERGTGFQMLPMPMVPGQEFELGNIATAEHPGQEALRQLMSRGHPLFGLGNAVFGSRDSFTDVPFESAPGIPLYAAPNPLARALHELPGYAGQIADWATGTRALPGRLDDLGNPAVEQTVRARRVMGTLPAGPFNLAADFVPAANATLSDHIARLGGIGLTATTPERAAAAALAKLKDRSDALKTEEKKGRGVR